MSIFTVQRVAVGLNYSKLPGLQEISVAWIITIRKQHHHKKRTDLHQGQPFPARALPSFPHCWDSDNFAVRTFEELEYSDFCFPLSAHLVLPADLCMAKPLQCCARLFHIDPMHPSICLKMISALLIFQYSTQNMLLQDIFNTVWFNCMYFYSLLDRLDR